MLSICESVNQFIKYSQSCLPDQGQWKDLSSGGDYFEEKKYLFPFQHIETVTYTQIEIEQINEEFDSD